jgi:hypothetical protein
LFCCCHKSKFYLNKVFFIVKYAPSHPAQPTPENCQLCQLVTILPPPPPGYVTPLPPPYSHPAHPETVGVNVQVKVPLYIARNDPPPPPPDPPCCEAQLAHAVPANVPVVPEYVKFQATSSITHHPPCHPGAPLFVVSHPPPLQGQTIIDLPPETACVRVGIIAFVAPAQKYATQPHEVHPQTSILSTAFAESQFVATQPCQPFPEKEKVVHVKSQSHCTLICTTHPVGVTVTVFAHGANVV